MSSLNLLPWREESRARTKQRFMLSALAAVALGALALSGWYFWIDQNIENQHARNNILQKEIALLDKDINEIKELEETRKALNDRISIIDRLQSTRPGIVHLFDEMVTALPNGLYLTKLKQEGSKIILQGKSESNARVSSYMDRLTGSPWLTSSNLDIISIDKKNTGDLRLRNFRLDVTQLLKPKTEEGKKDGSARTQ